MSRFQAVLSMVCSASFTLALGCRPSVFDELSRNTGRPSDAGMDASQEPDSGAHDSGPSSEFDAASDAAPSMDAAGSCGDTTSDPENCGECSIRCLPPVDGFATCQRSACREHRLVVSGAEKGPLHGGGGGAAFESSQLCDNGEVMIGLSGKADERIAYGLAVHCGRLSIAMSPSGYAVSVVPTTKGDELGGQITPTPPPYELMCPEGSVVSAVKGATWLWPGAPQRSVRQLSIACSQVSVDEDANVELTPIDTSLVVGDLENDTVETFAAVCPAGNVVAGLSGRNGSYIDAVAVHCGPVELQERGGKTAERDD